MIEANYTNYVVPPGQIWVCGACGKRSHDRYGYQKIDQGWDESCMLNAVLCHELQAGETMYHAVEEA